MSDTDIATDTVDTTEAEDVQTTDTVDTDTEDTWTPPDRATYEKLVEKAKTRDQRLREAQAKIKQLEKPEAKDAEPDPIEQANGRLIKAQARAALATGGITDKELQASVLSVLNLSGVEVDDDGEVDTDALDEIVANLRQAFGGTAAPARKISGKITAKDQGGSGQQSADPDSARRRAFLTGRGR